MNKRADALATSGTLAFGEILAGHWRGLPGPARERVGAHEGLAVRCWFDGGCREGSAGAGCWVQAARGPVGRVLRTQDSLAVDHEVAARGFGGDDWMLVTGCGSRLVDTNGDSLTAEVCGAGVCLTLL